MSVHAKHYRVDLVFLRKKFMHMKISKYIVHQEFQDFWHRLPIPGMRCSPERKSCFKIDAPFTREMSDFDSF